MAFGSSRARTAPACAYGAGTTTDYTGRFCRIRAAVAALPGEGEASIRGAPAGGRIGRRDERRHDRCGSAESGIIEDSDILLCRAVYGVRR
jgi:hypothetical protein